MAYLERVPDSEYDVRLVLAQPELEAFLRSLQGAGGTDDNTIKANTIQTISDWLAAQEPPAD